MDVMITVPSSIDAFFSTSASLAYGLACAGKKDGYV
jgi:hypothetical protein